MRDSSKREGPVGWRLSAGWPTGTSAKGGQRVRAAQYLGDGTGALLIGGDAQPHAAQAKLASFDQQVLRSSREVYQRIFRRRRSWARRQGTMHTGALAAGPA